MSFDYATVEDLYPEAGNLMIEPMLIWKLPAGKEGMLSEMCSNGEYFLEEKIDGAFYQFVKTENHAYLFGRTVSAVTKVLTEKGANVPHILSALDVLPSKTVLIGEIYFPGGTSKDTVSIMGCLAKEAVKRQEKKPIHYYVHDIIYYDGVDLINTGAEDRYRILKAIWEKYNLGQYDFLRLATRVDEELEAEISRILAAGDEGAVLKKRTAPYSPGKRPAWSTIKIKQMDSVDLVCMSFYPPTKEYTGKELETWPYWERVARYHPTDPMFELSNSCKYGEDDWYPVTKYYFLGWKTAIKIGAYDDNGKLIELGTVSSGLTEEDKKNITEHPEDYLGKVCSLDCMSIDKKEHTLRHPAFKAWRFDKNAADCKISEIFA